MYKSQYENTGIVGDILQSQIFKCHLLTFSSMQNINRDLSTNSHYIFVQVHHADSCEPHTKYLMKERLLLAE